MDGAFFRGIGKSLCSSVSPQPVKGRILVVVESPLKSSPDSLDYNFRKVCNLVDSRTRSYDESGMNRSSSFA
jgi:hypothetical protein